MTDQHTAWRPDISGHVLVFADGVLTLFRNGSGELAFDDGDLDWEEGEHRDVRVARLPASEIIAIRDQINRLFPPDNLRATSEAADKAVIGEVVDVLENLVIAIGMGWDLDGVVDVARALLARLDAKGGGE